MKNYLQKAKHIHLIGIGGSGMSGLAKILHGLHYNLSGSDQNNSPAIQSLQKLKIKISIGHRLENIPSETDLILYSSAIDQKNPERIWAKKQKIPELSYAQAVGELTLQWKTISICGTHGKTTTTALITSVFKATKQDPTVIVGAKIQALNNSNATLGKGDYFILESCEYRRAFLNYHPQIIVLNNIEPDHLDYYKNLADYQKAFLQFIYRLPNSGFLIANIDDPNIAKILPQIKKQQILTFGKSPKADYILKTTSIYHKKTKIAVLKLSIPGEHNKMNALAAITVAHHLHLPLKKSLQAINQYQGSSRRFELKGKIGKTIIIDDYGHHPTEIRATLTAAREKFGDQKKILCVFQPHQYSRTHQLLKEFATAFHDADQVMIPNIFAVRDSQKDLAQVSVAKLVNAIKKHQPNVSDGISMQKTLEYLKKNHHQFDVIIMMGAGDINHLSDSLLQS